MQICLSRNFILYQRRNEVKPVSSKKDNNNGFVLHVHFLYKDKFIQLHTEAG